MALTDGDKAEIKEMARMIVREVMAEHVKTCPHHQEYLISRARLVGMAVGIVLASSIGSGTAATVVTLVLRMVV